MKYVFTQFKSLLGIKQDVIHSFPERESERKSIKLTIIHNLERNRGLNFIVSLLNVMYNMFIKCNMQYFTFQLFPFETFFYCLELKENKFLMLSLPKHSDSTTFANQSLYNDSSIMEDLRNQLQTTLNKSAF